MAFVVYELEPTTKEANGTVHFFCSAECRHLGMFDADFHGCGEVALGENNEHSPGTICETCLRELD